MDDFTLTCKFGRVHRSLCAI